MSLNCRGTGAVGGAIASRLGIHTDPVVYDAESAKLDIGDWADGYALDQQMSSQKVFDQLGWRPKHTDVIAGVA